jgi:hypothetical protein
VNAVKHWGVILYILAGLVSISMPLVIAASPGGAATFFPQASFAEVVQAAQWSVANLSDLLRRLHG